MGLKLDFSLLKELAYMVRHPRKWWTNLQEELKEVDAAVQRTKERTIKRLTEGK